MAVLQALTQLTFLSIDGCIKVTAESLQHISCLQRLRGLGLQSHKLPLSPSHTPYLAQLTGLHTLSLLLVTLDPDLLQQYTQLQNLRLSVPTLSGLNSGASLLAVIAKQVQLRTLQLHQVDCAWPAAAAAFTTLTASSSLQELKLLLDGLPAGTLQAMLRPQQQLVHLRSLTFNIWCKDETGSDAPSVSSADVVRLASCCPGLQELTLTLQRDVQLTVLSQLTGLSNLTLHEASESTVKTLSAVTQLQTLDIFVICPFEQSAVVPLTSLRQLTELFVTVPIDDLLDEADDGPAGPDIEFRKESDQDHDV